MAAIDGPNATSTEPKESRPISAAASSIYSPDLSSNSRRPSRDGERPLTAPAAVSVDPAASTIAPVSPIFRLRSQSFTSAQSTPYMTTPEMSARGLSPMPAQKTPTSPNPKTATDGAGHQPPVLKVEAASHTDDVDDEASLVPVPWSVSPNRSPVPTHLSETDFSTARPKSRPSVKSIIASIREGDDVGLGLIVSPTDSEMDQKEAVSVGVGRRPYQLQRPDSSIFFSDKIAIATEPSEPSLIPVHTETSIIPTVAPQPRHGPWNSSTTSLTSLPARSATGASRHIPVPPPRSQSTPPVLIVPAQQKRNTRWPGVESATNNRLASPVSGHFEFRFSDRVVFHKGMVPQVSKLEEPDRKFTVELEGDALQAEQVPNTPRSLPASMRRRSQQLPSTTPTIPEGGSLPRRSGSHSSWPHSEYTTVNSDRTTVTEYQTSIEEEPETFYSAPERWKPALELELVTLWNNAQGFHPMKGDGRTFSLNVFPRFSPDPLGTGCLLEDFAFGLSAMSPFFTLKSGCVEPTCNAPATCRNHDQKHFSGVTVSRHRPLETEIIEHICNLKLPNNGRAAPDGLVTLIDPQRAVKLAMKALNPTIQTAMRAGTAVNLTLKPESCSIVWSKSNRHYELIHPKMPPMSGSPSPLIFEIIGGRVGLGDATATGTLKLVNTINKETLVMLDFGTSLLTVDTNATSKVESENIVDVAVVATIAVATVEGRLSRLGLSQGSSPLPAVTRYASTSTASQRTPTIPASIHHKSPTRRRSFSDHHNYTPYRTDPSSRFSSDEEDKRSTHTWSLKSKRTASSASSLSRISHKKKVHRAQSEAKVRLEAMRKAETNSLASSHNGEWPSALSPPPVRPHYATADGYGNSSQQAKKQNAVVRLLLLICFPFIWIWQKLTSGKKKEQRTAMQSGSMV